MIKQHPSNFTSFPYDSIMKKSEAEQIARNIMVILKRTGNTFRALGWDEYKAERKKDSGFSNAEKPYFDKVLEYCTTSKKAKTFSPAWRD